MLIFFVVPYVVLQASPIPLLYNTKTGLKKQSGHKIFFFFFWPSAGRFAQVLKKQTPRKNMCDQPVLAKRPFLAQCRRLLHIVPVLFVRARFGFKVGGWVRAFWHSKKSIKNYKEKTTFQNIFFSKNFLYKFFLPTFFYSLAISATTGRKTF